MKNIFKLGSVFMAIALVVSTLLFTGVFASADQVVASWEGHTNYIWAPSSTSHVLGTEAQPGEFWKTFAEGLGDLGDDQYVKITVTANFVETPATAGFKSRTWSINTAIDADSISATTLEYTIEGPLTYNGTDPNLEFVVPTASLTGLAEEALSVSVTIYKKGGSSETTATGAATEVEPTATAAPTEPSETEPSETEPSATEPSASEPVVEPTDVEPTATEAEKVYHAIDSWSDTNGVSYTWLNPNNASGQIQVYYNAEGTNGKWEEFAGKWATIADNQYVEIVYTGTFAGATKDAVSADSRVWNETVKSSDFIVSASDDQIVVRFYGPLTSRMMDPNLGLFFAENSLAAISAEGDTHVTVTVYEEGEEPTQPTTESTEPVVDPTGTEPSESTPSQSETTPSESKTDPSQPTAVILGDANGDGAVNMKDVLLARKYLAGIDVTIDLVAADVNEDGAVNMKDILEMRKFLANIIDHFGA